ncbi:MAG: hypothetical protein IOC90_07185 [Methylocystis sp.]|nr:hypothetical protein [Methylocystis sp.]MCA3585317.1 hypothetical protein [Methylocystis sp.]MCA3587803.1 hypothetical protein [Methylocystis sp.]MCA3593194.1 hypothetical protein [Methylocystis sp.]
MKIALARLLWLDDHFKHGRLNMVFATTKQMDDELKALPEHPSVKLFPRAEPLSFGYMFVAVNNPYKDL